jgi:hypothetical protein
VPVGQCRHTRHREEKCGVAGTEINEKLRGWRGKSGKK